jgi:hypothetical protein
MEGENEMKRNLIVLWSLGLTLCLVAAGRSGAQDPKQMMQEKAAALKQSVVTNQQVLKQYSWIDKTELSVKGEVKNTKLESCSYGPDGKVQKTLLTEPPEPSKKRGLRGKVVEKKTGEMKDYMASAIKLIGRYVPPSPDTLQAVVAAGKASLSQAGPDAVQLIFKDYALPGDSYMFTLDKAGNAMRRLDVDTYLDKPEDKVTLVVDFQTLPDGTRCVAKKVLNTAAKEIVVTITSSDYKKLAQ